MPVRLCAESGCPNPATYRGRWQAHARTTNRRTHRNRHIYNSRRWQMLRRRVLFEQPLCECGVVATDADHIIPIEQGGPPYARANVQAMCATCHGRKTKAEQHA